VVNEGAIAGTLCASRGEDLAGSFPLSVVDAGEAGVHIYFLYIKASAKLGQIGCPCRVTR
jgi:hypothetical protein